MHHRSIDQQTNARFGFGTCLCIGTFRPLDHRGWLEAWTNLFLVELAHRFLDNQVGMHTTYTRGQDIKV